MGETPSPGSYVVLSSVPLKLEADEGELEDWEQTQSDLDAVSIGVPFGTEYHVGESIRFGKQGMYLTVEPIDRAWFAQIDAPTMAIWIAELGRPPVAGLLCHFEYSRLPWHPICVHAAWTIQQRHPRARIRLWNSMERRFGEIWEIDWDEVIDWVNEQIGYTPPDSVVPDPQPKKRGFWRKRLENGRGIADRRRSPGRGAALPRTVHYRASSSRTIARSIIRASDLCLVRACRRFGP